MSAKEIRKQAWQDIKKNWKPMVLMHLILYAIAIGFALLSFIGIGFIAIIIIMPAFYLGIAMSVLKIVRKQEIKTSNLYDGFGNMTKSCGLYLVNSIFVSLWSLLLIVPGIIKNIEYSMSPFILADNPDYSVSDARNESIRIMNGNKKRFFCLQLSFIGWILLCILTCGILYLWIAPYIQTANAIFYESIKPRKVKYTPLEDEKSVDSQYSNAI